jgi:hypothetical protein
MSQGHGFATPVSAKHVVTHSKSDSHIRQRNIHGHKETHSTLQGHEFDHAITAHTEITACRRNVFIKAVIMDFAIAVHSVIIGVALGVNVRINSIRVLLGA